MVALVEATGLDEVIIEQYCLVLASTGLSNRSSSVRIGRRRPRARISLVPSTRGPAVLGYRPTSIRYRVVGSATVSSTDEIASLSTPAVLCSPSSE